MNLKDTKNDADEELILLCEHISNTERKSTSAERKTIDRLIALLYQNRIDEVLEGTIISIHKFGIFVSMDNGMAEALLPIRGLPHDWYNYDEKEQTLNGENSGYFFKSGMELSVKITEVTPLTGSITVKWYSGGSQSIIKNKRRRRRR